MKSTNTTENTMNQIETNTTDTRTALADVAENLRTALALYDKAAGDSIADQAERKRLAAEIAHDTSAVSLDDPAALQLLAGKKQRLELLTNRVASPDAVLSPLIAHVREALRPVPDSLRAFLSPVRESLLEDISKTLEPYESDAGRRRQIANDTPAARKLYALATCYWAVFDAIERPVATAQRVLADLEKILAGEKPWLQP